MKRMSATLIMSLILCFPLFAGAHGDATHVMGTVTETAQNHITVKTPKGKMVKLHFTDDTMFQENGITRDKARPRVGNRLVAEAATVDGKLVAVEVKFASPRAK